MQMVPHPYERKKKDQLRIEILFIIAILITYLKKVNIILFTLLLILSKRVLNAISISIKGVRFLRNCGAALVGGYERVI